MIFLISILSFSLAGMEVEEEVYLQLMLLDFFFLSYSHPAIILYYVLYNNFFLLIPCLNKIFFGPFSLSFLSSLFFGSKHISLLCFPSFWSISFLPFFTFALLSHLFSTFSGDYMYHRTLFVPYPHLILPSYSVLNPCLFPSSSVFSPTLYLLSFL